MILRRIVICDKRHHALTDTDPDIKRQSFSFQNNANSSKRNIPVGCHQLINDHIVYIKQQSRNRRRNADIKLNMEPMLLLSGKPFLKLKLTTDFPLVLYMTQKK